MAYTGKSVDQNQSSRARIMTKEDMDREILNAVRSPSTKPWQMLWWAGMLVPVSSGRTGLWSRRFYRLGFSVAEFLFEKEPSSLC